MGFRLRCSACLEPTGKPFTQMVAALLTPPLAASATPFALNITMADAADAPKREQLGRASLRALGVLPAIPAQQAPAP